MQRYAVLAYIPPPHLPYAEPFLRNIQKHKRTASELILYSDHPWPDVLHLNGSPDGHQWEKSFGISNLVFYTGMTLAAKMGFSHVLYIEADSRVMGDGWDEVIFKEFINQRVPAIIGGSVAVHNPCNAGREAALRWEELVANNSRRNFPIATHTHVPVLAFGNKGSNERAESCVFCYGSGTVIDMAWWKILFSDEERNPPVVVDPESHQFGIARKVQAPVVQPGEGFSATHLARQSAAWDIELGKRIWSLFGADSYDVIANLPSVFSGFGNEITTEEERLGMLRDGSRRLAHQIKSAAEV